MQNIMALVHMNKAEKARPKGKKSRDEDAGVLVQPVTEPMSARRQAMLNKKRTVAAAEENNRAKQEAPNNKKAKKDATLPPPPWTETDKDIFFQGLLMCGKDFDKLHKFCVQKMKSKDEETRERSKDQIRHFYYRTLRNIQNIVEMDRVSRNKEANELFAIINFAELRRRTTAKPAVIYKYGQQLKQLIYTGETRFKYKGKTIKIKTPTCAPLQNLMLHADEMKNKDKKKKAKIPEVLTVEFQPKTNAAWQRVTDITHNPNLRVKVKPDQSLSSIIEAMERKWVPSCVRFRRELSLDKEWDKLPYLRVVPSHSVKLQPFELSTYKPQPPSMINFDEFLKVNTGVTSRNSAEELTISSGEVSNVDPVKFLKEKLHNITSQLQVAETSHTKQPPAIPDAGGCVSEGEGHTQSLDLITQATHGWTSANSKQLYMGHLFFLYGGSDKLILEYEWPELERCDEVIHIFHGMIDRLLALAHNEFSMTQAKKKQGGSPSTLTSPTIRGRKLSPSTHKGLGSPNGAHSMVGHIHLAPKTDSPEFKKPLGVPLHSENRQLADAIALGRQELKPHSRNALRKPTLVQRTLMPKHILSTVQMTVSGGLVQPAVKVAQSADTIHGTTQVMDVSCILAGKKSAGNSVHASSSQTIVTVKSTSSSCDPAGSASSGPAHHPAGPQLKSLLSNHNHQLSSNSSGSVIQNLLPSISVGSDKRTSSGQALADNSHLVASTMDSQPSLDILAQAMSAIQTPVKVRRITPTLISSAVGVEVSDDTVSQQSLGSLIGNVTTGVSLELRSGAAAQGKSGPQLNSFEGILHKKGDSQHFSGRNSPQSDSWLTPDVMLTDFSLSSLLGDRSPRQGGENSCSTIDVTTRVPNAHEMDDSRLSFLSKLDVHDLGLESSLPGLLMENSLDYSGKLYGSSTLETPQKPVI